MDVKFFDSLFEGESPNGIKLGMALTGGDFWARIGGCQNLYRGQSPEAIDFTDILCVNDIGTDSVEVPQTVEHQAGTVYFYVLRRADGCGREEQSLTAVTKIAFDSNGDLVGPGCNKIFTIWVRQIKGSKAELVWYYCPIKQGQNVKHFNIYWDNGTGQIDYENSLSTVEYTGPRFYRFQTSSLNVGEYLFSIRAAANDGSETEFLGSIRFQINNLLPQAIDTPLVLVV